MQNVQWSYRWGSFLSSVRQLSFIGEAAFFHRWGSLILLSVRQLSFIDEAAFFHRWGSVLSSVRLLTFVGEAAFFYRWGSFLSSVRLLFFIGEAASFHRWGCFLSLSHARCMSATAPKKCVFDRIRFTRTMWFHHIYAEFTAIVYYCSIGKDARGFQQSLMIQKWTVYSSATVVMAWKLRMIRLVSLAGTKTPRPLGKTEPQEN